MASETVPTRQDAAAAAAALLAEGAEEVLLFGSVARGDADEHSDIDLVALFADIDYTQRGELQSRLAAAAEAAVGRWPVQVKVTDRPEWRRRVAEVSSSVEHRIAADAVVVASSARRAPVRWDKEMIRPMSNPTEALAYFTTTVRKQLSTLHRSLTQGYGEVMSALPPEEHEEARLNRMLDGCADAALVVELSLKALATLYGDPMPDDRELRRTGGHDIEACLAMIPEQHREMPRRLLDTSGLDIAYMSGWRIRATYPDDVDLQRATADDLIERYTQVALKVCAFAVHEICAEVGPTPAMLAAIRNWEHYATAIANQDPRTGLTRSGDPEPYRLASSDPPLPFQPPDGPAPDTRHDI